MMDDVCRVSDAGGSVEFSDVKVGAIRKSDLDSGVRTQYNTHFNFSERERYAIARPSVVYLSVVCNVRAPYSGGSNFRQYFYGIRYLGHPLTSNEDFTEIVPGQPLRRGT